MNTLITPSSKQSQKKRLLSYLKKHRKGITTYEAFEKLRITCVHKRIAELEGEWDANKGDCYPYVIRITRTVETNGKSRYVRYALAR